LQVGHVHVEGLEARLGEGVGHLDVGVDALLAQDGHARAGTANHYIMDSCLGIFGAGQSHVSLQIFGQHDGQAGVCRVARRGMLGIGARGVVALLGDLPAHASHTWCRSAGWPKTLPSRRATR
jgi:hypothetical protein